MASSTETPAAAIKSFIATISPFVCLAFALIQYIYTTQSADKQAAIVEAKREAKELKEQVGKMEISSTLYAEQIKNLTTRVENNTGRIETLTNRQNEVEKTVILTNANRR